MCSRTLAGGASLPAAEEPAETVCLGDLIEAAPSVETELSYLESMGDFFQKDGLPLNEKGDRIWNKVVKQWLSTTVSGQPSGE